MTEASAGTGSPSRTALPAVPVWRAGLLAALAATVVNALVWVLLQQVLDVGLQIPVQPGSTELNELPLGAVVFVTAFSSLIGAVVLWLLTRRGPSGSASGRSWPWPSGSCRPCPPSGSTCPRAASSAWSCSTSWPRWS